MTFDIFPRNLSKGRVVVKSTPWTSDFAELYQNSFRGPLISRTFFRSAGSARSSGSVEFTWPSLYVETEKLLNRGNKMEKGNLLATTGVPC